MDGASSTNRIWYQDLQYNGINIQASSKAANFDTSVRLSLSDGNVHIVQFDSVDQVRAMIKKLEKSI